jgi:ribosomal protein S18 acetylase RimI-like enzyme
MRELILRQARSGDGAGLARIWIDGAAHYASLAPEAFQVPRAEGLAEWLEQEALSTETYSHVAVLDDELVGHVWAAVLPPSAQAAWQMLRDLTHTRLTIHWLGVLGAHRRQGIGTRLMVAAESWGRNRGAEVAGFSTYVAGPLAVPFYERGMGYRRQGLYFTKRL